MSTRATYEIGDRTFYVHHDGYPSGAADKFRMMIAAMTVPGHGRGIDAIADRRGGAQFAFIRGNMNAEPTEGHNAHGDTEYRWKIEAADLGKLLVRSRRRPVGEDHWTAWDAGCALECFVNTYQPGAIVAIDAPDEHYRRKLYATLENAIAIAAEYRQKEASFAEGNPNRPRYAAHAAAWELEILEQIPERARWLEKNKRELEADLAKNGAWGRSYYVDAIAETQRELEVIRAPIGELAAA